jgi:hypothetical protein
MKITCTTYNSQFFDLCSFATLPDKSDNMSTTTINQTIAGNYAGRVSRTSLLKRFLTWSDNQQPDRLLWLGIGLAVHGCIITPLVFFVVLLTGVHMTLLALAMFAMALVLIVNLAALPTKITIPAFFLSILVDLIVLISAFALF